MKKPFILPLIATIGTLLFLPTATAQLSNSKSKSPTSALVTAQVPSVNLRQIAQAITVKIYAEDSRSSGILVAKNGQAYTVLTNAHVVNRGESYRIQTPDGKVYQARLINKGDSLKGNDLAVLQFQATVNYRIATLGDSSALAKNQEVYTAGFPFDQKNLSFTSGKISLIADKPLVGGYQIGYTNETVQGMSGGAVLNREGKLIGVIGMGAAAILNDAYIYQDGTKPNKTAFAQLRESSFAVPIATLAKVAPQLIAIIPKPDNQETTANPPTYTGIVADVDNIAQQITVRIDGSKNCNGSGVIIAKQGQTYYVLTANHVFQDCANDQYQIVTHDGQQYRVKPTAVTSLEGVELAVVKFQSQERYTVATLGNYDILLDKAQLTFVSGFPGVDTGMPKRLLTAGAVLSQELTSVFTKYPDTLAKGYELLYTNLSRPGMSGGPILDRLGRVIGINAASDNEPIENFDKKSIQDSDKKSIRNREVYVGTSSFGIPISTFLGRVEEIRIKPEDMKIKTSVPHEIPETEVNAIFNQLLNLKRPLENASDLDWLNYGNELLRSRKFDESLAALNKVISLNPNLYQAYYLRSQIFSSFKGKFKEAMADIKEAIRRLRPNSLQFWQLKSSLLFSTGKYTEALKAIDKAIEINSKFEQESHQVAKIKPSFTLSLSRIGILMKLRRYQEALEENKKIIDTNSYAIGYIFRGVIYFELKEYEKAFNDIDQAIKLKPDNPNYYILRGQFYEIRKERQKALNDYNQAIKLQPSNTELYINRAVAYQEFGDNKKAIADFNQAIKLDRKKAKSYIARAQAYQDFGDNKRAIANYNKAIEVDPENPELYIALARAYRAMADFNKAIEVDPENLDNYITRATYEDNKRAMADYNKAIELLEVPAQAYHNPDNYITRTTYEYNKRAMANFNKAIEVDKKNPNSYIARAEAYHELKDNEKVIADSTKAIDLDPENPDYYITRSGAYHELKDNEKAIADSTKAIDLDPENPDYYFIRAIYEKSEKDYEKAIADFTKAIKLDPKNPIVIYSIPFIPRSYIERGDAYWESKDYQKALPDYIKAIEIYENPPFLPNSKESRINLRRENIQEEGSSLQGIESRLDEIPSSLLAFNELDRDEYERTRSKIVKIYLNSKEYQKAIFNLTKIIKQNPNFFELYFHRGSAYLELNEYKNGIADLTKAIEIIEKKNNSIECDFDFKRDLLCVKEWSLYVNRGLAYKNQQDYLKAIKDFNKAAEILKSYRNQEEYKRVQKYLIELASKNPEPYIEKARIYYGRGDYKNALANYTKAIEVAPQESEFYASRGHVYLWLKNYQKAFFDYNKAIALDSENSFYYIHRAEAYLKVKDYQKAFVDYNKVIKIYTKDISKLSFKNDFYYINRAKAYLKVKDYQKAFADYNEAIAIEPDAFNYINRAEAYLETRDYQKAFADYNKAIEIDAKHNIDSFPEDFPKNSLYYIDRAEAYLKVKNYQNAIADYNKAIEIKPDAYSYTSRAKAYLEIKDYQKAFADYNKAIAIEPNTRNCFSSVLAIDTSALKCVTEPNAYNYIARSEAYLEIKDYQKAITDYTKVINFQPNNPIFYNSRGLAYFRSQNYQPSILDYNKALELQPDYANSYYNRGLAYKKLKNYRKAIIDIQKAVQIYLQQDNQEGYKEAQNELINLQKLL